MQFLKQVFNGTVACITLLKQQKSKKVLLLRSTLTLWRCDNTFSIFAVLVV